MDADLIIAPPYPVMVMQNQITASGEAAHEDRDSGRRAGSALLLFTDTFPYGWAEPFLETEIGYLARRFGRIIVIPANASESQRRRDVPTGVEVELGLSRLHAARSKVGVLVGAAVAGSFYKELLERPAIVTQPRSLHHLASHVAAAVRTRNWLDAFLKQEGLRAPVLYTYWCRADALGVVLLKRRRPELTCVSRAHGIDVYAERYRPAYLPMQRATLEGLDCVFAVSQHGHDYLAARHPSAVDTLEVARLGVLEPGFTTPASEDGMLRVVSCSTLSPVKRVAVLIDGLAVLAARRPQQQIEWHHLGDGPQLAELTERARQVLPASVHWRFHGRVANNEVFGFYAARPVDVFANVSESEGIPVSIMEAMSCGIPALATAVGGTPELIEEGSGMLLSSDPSPEQVADGLARFLPESARAGDRSRSRLCWEARYDAARNYTAFADRLSGLGAAPGSAPSSL
jgi:glycosyltransferase involved in cell wall biosynthesis